MHALGLCHLYNKLQWVYVFWKVRGRNKTHLCIDHFLVLWGNACLAIFKSFAETQGSFVAGTLLYCH